MKFRDFLKRLFIWTAVGVATKRGKVTDRAEEAASTAIKEALQDMIHTPTETAGKE